MIAFLRGLSGSVITTGLEADSLSQWLHRRLAQAGLEVVLMETRQVKGAPRAMPIKTDRRTESEVRRLAAARRR